VVSGQPARSLDGATRAHVAGKQRGPTPPSPGLSILLYSGRTATLEINGHHVQLHPFEGAAIPPHVAHQMMNLSDAPLELLVISQPNSRDDRVLLDALEGERP